MLSLGIDAAWTRHYDSGVALLECRTGRWRCLRVGATLDTFLHGGATDPGGHAGPPGGDIGLALPKIVEKSLGEANSTLAVIAVDMPLARGVISGRRVCDNLVSREYGRRGCAVHSPTAARPGDIAAGLREASAALSFPLVTHGAHIPALIEVYPHVALLELMQAEYRIPYKISRRRRYWPRLPAGERINNIIRHWCRIVDALSTAIDDLPMWLCRPREQSLRRLKAHEDAIDAIVCAWVGTLFVEGRARAIGNADAAIWAPLAS